MQSDWNYLTDVNPDEWNETTGFNAFAQIKLILSLALRHGSLVTSSFDAVSMIKTSTNVYSYSYVY